MDYIFWVSLYNASRLGLFLKGNDLWLFSVKIVLGKSLKENCSWEEIKRPEKFPGLALINIY